jgi:hypothetical protein
MTDQLGDIVKYRGNTPPTPQAPGRVVSADVTVAIQTAIQWCHDEVGLSEQASTGQTTLGANATGAGMREEVGIQQDRFAAVSFAWDEFHVDLAEAILDAADRLYTGSSKVRLRSPDGTFEELKWNEVKMDKDSYQLQAFSVSTLPQSPGGRIETIKEMMDLGTMDKQEATWYMGSLDISALNNMATAGYRAASKLVRSVVKGPKLEMPTEWHDLDQVFKLAYDAYNDIMSRDEQDEGALKRLSALLTAVAEDRNPPQPPPAPPQPAAPPMPGAEAGAQSLPQGAPIQ